MDQGIAVAGSYVADSLASVHAGGVHSEGLGPSQGGGPLLCTLREFVGVASPLVDPVGLCPVDSLGSLGFLSGVSSAVSSVPSSSSGPSLFPSSSGVTSRRLPCLSLVLVSLFPRPFLPFLRLASLFLLRASLGLLLSSLCFLALPWLLSPPSLLSPHWLLRSPCLTWFLTCWHQSSLPRCALALLLFLFASSSLSVVSSSLVLFVASSLVPRVASTSSADVTSCSFSTGSLLSVVVCSVPSAPSLPPPPASFLPSFLVAGPFFFFC